MRTNAPSYPRIKHCQVEKWALGRWALGHFGSRAACIVWTVACCWDARASSAASGAHKHASYNLHSCITRVGSDWFRFYSRRPAYVFMGGGPRRGTRARSNVELACTVLACTCAANRASDRRLSDQGCSLLCALCPTRVQTRRIWLITASSAAFQLFSYS
jgi:hypothetical protein